MKLKTVLTEAPKWTKHPTRKGVLTRTISPEERKREEEKESAPKKSASNEQKWLQPIPELDVSEIKKACKNGGNDIGAEIEEATRGQSFVKEVTYDPEHIGVPEAKRKYKFKSDSDMPKRKVAAVKYDLFVYYDAKEAGIETDADHVEEMVKIIIYRDPINPKRLIGTY